MNAPRIISLLLLLLACWLCPCELMADIGPGTLVQFLSGTGKDDPVRWDFFCTAGMHSGVWTNIAVPSCWEPQGFGVYNYGTRFRAKKNEDVALRPGFASEQGKYKTKFTVPAAWQGRVVRIVFAGVMVKTEVFVNGHLAGPAHEGSFYEFKYDITSFINCSGTNLLEVTVSKVADDPSVMRAERQGDFWNFGGIYRPVFLEALPAKYIDWTGIAAQASGDFKADVHLGPGVNPEHTRVTGELLDADGRTMGKPFSAQFPETTNDSASETLTLSSHFDGMKLWSAETPCLYKARFTLVEGDVPQHTITNRFGFRTIELRTNDGFYLNGVKIVMKGVNRHSLWADTGRTLSRDLCYEDARLIKDMNMNAVRMSHYPPDRDFLEACDEEGIYVLDELTGWQSPYDTPVGKKLVGEMVRRDVNHPSILVWDNGNEGGWNNDLNDEFAKWDIQQRCVLHPRSKDRGVNDPHYPDYNAILRESGGPAVYFPTEFLHGLYDGGLGSGFADYWNVLRKSPVLGGAFFWVMCDDGVVRTDKGGIVDNEGDQGPDGIMGPRREKEGSYYTIKEIWSPVEIEAPAGGLQPGFQGALKVRNNYDFTDLNQCQFSYEFVQFLDPVFGKFARRQVFGRNIPIPSIPPHCGGELPLKLPAAAGIGAVYLTAKDPAGRTLWVWSWPGASAQGLTLMPSAGGIITTSETGGQLLVHAFTFDLSFDKATGFLIGVDKLGRGKVPLGNGPRFIAYAHNHRGKRTITYDDVSGTNTLTSLTMRRDGKDVLVEAKYAGAFRQATWRISPNDKVRLDYTYNFEGPVDLLGVNFDFPEKEIKSITWLGYGPYRVWQNRLQGTRLDVWHNPCNNTVPGVVYSSAPEFKGYFRGWRWATFETSAGNITAGTTTPESYLGVYTPNDGPDGPLLALPQTGLAFLEVIPAMRDKFLTQERMGPQSAQKTVAGEYHGEVTFDFGVN